VAAKGNLTIFSRHFDILRYDDSGRRLALGNNFQLDGHTACSSSQAGEVNQMKTLIPTLSFLLALGAMAGRSIHRNYHRAEGRHWEGTGTGKGFGFPSVESLRTANENFTKEDTLCSPIGRSDAVI
jgi:hypothetical protein